MRHNTIIDILKKWAIRVGVNWVITEPADLDPDTDIRPDMLFFCEQLMLITDVRICHPGAKSYLRKGNPKCLKTAKDAETEKHKMYDKLAQTNNAVFIPFVVETLGGFGPEAIKLLHALLPSEEDPTSSIYPHWQSKRIIIEEISIALQKSNAIIMTRSFSKSKGQLFRN